MNDGGKVRKIQRAPFSIGPNAVVTIGDSEEVVLAPAEEAQIARVSDTLVAYRVALKNLLDGKYAALKHLIPTHMTDACRAMTFILQDGIIVRYDLKQAPDEKGLVGLTSDSTLALVAPALSGNFVHCPVDTEGYDPGENVATITLSAAPVEARHQQQPFMSQRLYAVVRPQAGPVLQAAQPPARPALLVGLRNEFDLHIVGELMPEGGGVSQQFVMRSRFRLPLGWEAFEVFPPYNEELWDPKLAPFWAEADLLGAVVQRNMIDDQFRTIDPRAQTRKKVAKMLSDFKNLLDGPEEPIHQFIKTNPSLLLPTLVEVRSKLPLGAVETDFVLRDASNEYLLVELEKASHQLFGKKGQPLAPLVHAIDQISDWRRYIADNVATVQRELGLSSISPNPRGLVVIGRSSSLSAANRRKLIAMESDNPRLRIMTYDDLLANATATFENILGPLWDPGPNAEVYFLPPQPASK